MLSGFKFSKESTLGYFQLETKVVCQGSILFIKGSYCYDSSSSSKHRGLPSQIHFRNISWKTWVKLI